MEVKVLITVLQNKYMSSKGFMGVDCDKVKTVEDLFENVRDEITSIVEILENSVIEDEEGYDMTTREARGYLKKLNNFIEKYEIK